MSVCMSAVSAGISEVLIKYTGNVWLHMNVSEKRETFFFFSLNFFFFLPIGHRHSTLAVTEAQTPFF